MELSYRHHQTNSLGRESALVVKKDLIIFERSDSGQEMDHVRELGP